MTNDCKPDDELSALHLLHRAGQCADELFAAETGSVDLTPRQYEVMRVVARADEPSQTTLVAATGIDRSTLADIVRRLVARGLLSRRRTRRDARMYAIRLTEAGRAALSAVEPGARKSEQQLLQSLPEKLRTPFLEALASMVRKLGPIASARVDTKRRLDEGKRSGRGAAGQQPRPRRGR